MATLKQKLALKEITENHRSVSAAMRKVGYKTSTATKPSNLTKSKGWESLMETYLSDERLAKSHDALLNSTRVDHLIFPLGPERRSEKELDLSKAPKVVKTMLDAEEALRQTDLSDEEITELLAEVNCTVRRIVHGETARHVYFWSADNKALKEGLDMAYKLKGRYYSDKKDSEPGSPHQTVIIIQTPHGDTQIGIK